MKPFKRALVFLLIAIITVSSVSASVDEAATESSDLWWVGMPISGFEYTGLINVDESTVDDVLSPYIGEDFSDELFNRIYNVLYAQNWVEYISAEAIRGGTTGESLIIRFNIVVQMF